MSYAEWLSDWPFLFAALSIPVLLLLLALVALWSRRSRWKTSFYLVVAYLVIANLAGLFVYQWVPSQYTRDQNWSWPPADERSLGFTHGKRLAIAADKGVSAPRWVLEERADFFRSWLLGPTAGGLALAVFVVLASRASRVGSSKGGNGQLTRVDR